MKRAIIILSFLILIAVGCESPTSNEVILPPPVQIGQLEKVDIEQIDYNVIQFKNRDDLYLDSVSVSQIITGYYENQNFIPVDSLNPEYQTMQNGKYLLSFSDSLVVPDSTIYITVGLKYLLTNNDSLTMTKNFFLLTYPYNSTQLLDYYSNFVLPTLIWIQDFVYRPPLMYYHPYGSEGLYEYNFKTNETEYLLPYDGGDFIDANNNYAFIDYYHTSVLRYNLINDSAEMELDLKPILNASFFSIGGIAANDSVVYILTFNPEKLIVLSINLEIVDIKDFAWGYCCSMTYMNSYLYAISYDFHNSHILKIDPTSAQVLDSRLCPSISTNAIKIYDGKLYFVDGEQKSFGYTPLDDIFN